MSFHWCEGTDAVAVTKTMELVSQSSLDNATIMHYNATMMHQWHCCQKVLVVNAVTIANGIAAIKQIGIAVTEQLLHCGENA